MALLRIKEQDFQKLRGSRQHDLFETINKFLPGADDRTKGVVAGLCIEYVIRSGGDPDIFIDELLIDSEEDGFEEEL